MHVFSEIETYTFPGINKLNLIDIQTHIMHVNYYKLAHAHAMIQYYPKIIIDKIPKLKFTYHILEAAAERLSAPGRELTPSILEKRGHSSKA